MKIKYLDGSRFFRGLQVGSKAVIRSQDELNRINVFPVADADTGFNLVMTLQAILQNSMISRSIKDTMHSVADSALTGARGNSGIIFAQFLHGFSHELPKEGALEVKNFATSAQHAVQYLYDSLMNPVEGTMLTVIREWTEFLVEQSSKTSDFLNLLTNSLVVARKSLAETPTKLKALADAGVVDAGASGFVYFLEGIIDFIHRGSLRDVKTIHHDLKATVAEVHAEKPGEFRYCMESLLSGGSSDLNSMKEIFARYGDSLILAGGNDRLHLHIHTNTPMEVQKELMKLGEVSGIKVDDMLRQYQVNHERKFPIGLVTDSAGDLPLELMDRYQIMQIPFGLSFGKRFYLDKLTMQTQEFYDQLRYDKSHPVSSQPSPTEVKSTLRLASQNYDEVIAVHLSDKLSGIYASSKSIAQKEAMTNVSVVDSRQLSVTEGLITYRVARAIEEGMSKADILAAVDAWSDHTPIYTDVYTLRYMVRGGRVKPLAGFVAAVLNIKPIVSLDKEGKALILGKSFNRKGNMTKILAMIKAEYKKRGIWEYAIVHADAEARALQYAAALTAITGKTPAYIMPLSPVVGVHNGVGAVAVGVSYERT